MKKLFQPNSIQLFLAVLLILLFFINVLFTQKSDGKISTDKDIKAEIELAPCKNEDRFESVKKLFSKMGAKDENIEVQKFQNGENLVVTKKGKSDETIVVGAHYDKVSNGCGAIDNWTGIVIAANLYRSLRDVPTEKTYKFVAFGKEEVGLFGSKAFVKQVPPENLPKYCAMLNLDSFGFTTPQALENISDAKLMNLARQTSNEMKIPYFQTSVAGASSDSASFRKAKIPAISLHGMAENWRDYLHTAKDSPSEIDFKSIYASYLFAVNFTKKIDAENCGFWRE